MTRLWTYQESELARAKYFQFSDGAVTARSLNTKYASELLGYPYTGPVGLLHTDRESQMGHILPSGDVAMAKTLLARTKVTLVSS